MGHERLNVTPQQNGRTGRDNDAIAANMIAQGAWLVK